MKDRSKKIREIQDAWGKTMGECFAKMVKKMDEGKDDWQDKTKIEEFQQKAIGNISEGKYINAMNFLMFLHRLAK